MAKPSSFAKKEEAKKPLPIPPANEQETPSADVTPPEVPADQPAPAVDPVPPAEEGGNVEEEKSSEDTGSGEESGKPYDAVELVAMHRELDLLHQTFVERVKDVKNETSGETPDQVRLGAVQFLKSGEKLMHEMDVKMDELTDKERYISTESAKVNAAKQFIVDKSDRFNSERDAFAKLHDMSEIELMDLLEKVRENA